MQQRKISVIIPVYNEERMLPKCLEALMQQTRKPDEILVVDNNSTDSSAAIARRFNGVVLISESEQGIVYARNRGFDAATGDILVKIDSDTLTHKEWLMRVEQEFAGDVQAVSGYVGAHDGGKFSSLTMTMANFFAFTMNGLVCGHPFLYGANYALTKEAWQKIRNQVTMRNDIWEDLDVALTLNENGFKLSTIHQRLADISLRSVNDSVPVLLDRAMGNPRAYWIHSKVRAVLATPIVIAGFLAAVLTSFTLGERVSKRSKPD